MRQNHIQNGMLAAIRVYKTTISPLIPMCCRYLPTCADYTAEAIQTHGAMRGGWIGFKRICRCHPLGGRGYDPVPSSTRDPAEKGSPSGLTTRHS